MDVFLTLIWFLTGAAAGWGFTSLRLARTAARDRQQMRSEIHHSQSETDRYRATADRLAQDKEAWAAGCKQGRDDVITIMPMLLAAQQRLPGQDPGPATTQMNNCA